ncbi:AraC family transcriptional regulator [Tamlana agarivorans]|uniref:AraC family transcriptional regulator n=1 Tax=Pseudotamlana agarivorans TaxID=481183 RepID=A0ACC5UB13_9FLAO|nr:AraC family transcriptional regulator [Tamlana agarivorans]MBU2951516.1 AraC family transcriptional regulator [Tamlana agarivorans]
MAKRFFINKDLDVLEFEAVTEWGYPRHKHNFFELTFVLKGAGQHLLNDSIINYQAGDIFFLTPKDEHEFIISEPTTFGIIKFTEQLFLEKSTFTSSTYWRKNIETVIFHSNVIAESIVHYETDKSQLIGLYYLIKNEMNNTLAYNRNVLTELFGALLIVLSRNLKSRIKNESHEQFSDEEKVENILTYIRQNVLNKERVKLKTIAETFYMSPNYVGLFIKKHAGISVQQYVIQTKIKMAEQLLKQSNLNITEISEKLGFVDSSHFNRTFKKYTGENPSAFFNKTN